MGDKLYPSIGQVSDLEAWIPDLPQGNKDETLLQRLLDSASQALQGSIGRDMTQVLPYTEYRTVPASHRIMLRTQPALTLTSVAFVPAGYIDTSYQPVTVSATPNDAYAYLLDGQVYVPRFVGERHKLQIVYTAGFSEVPADLYQAVLEVAAQKYKERTHISQESKTIQGESVHYTTKKWSNHVADIVARYRSKVYS